MIISPIQTTMHLPLQRLIKPLNPLQVTTSWLCISSVALKHQNAKGIVVETKNDSGQLEHTNSKCVTFSA